MRTLFFAVVGIMLLIQTGDAAEKRPVAATVNGVEITADQVDAEVQRFVPQVSYHRTLSAERKAAFSEKALDNLIVFELQYQEAKKRGIKADPDKVKEEMGRIRDRFPSKKEYRSELKRSGMSEDGLRAMVERVVIIQAVVDEVVTKPSIMNDEALQDYYKRNLDKFLIPERVKVRLISIRDEERAREAAAKLKAGERFEEVAARMSEDKFRINGGSMGYVHKGQIVADLEEDVFQSPLNAVKGPIKASGFWIFFVVEEKEAARQMGFAESKEKLKKELESKKASEIKDKWTSELKAKANIVIYSTAE